MRPSLLNAYLFSFSQQGTWNPDLSGVQRAVKTAQDQDVVSAVRDTTSKLLQVLFTFLPIPALTNSYSEYMNFIDFHFGQ